MLATSLSPSPSTFKLGSIENGSGSLLMYQSSPRNLGPPSRRSPLSISRTPNPSGPPSPPPLRANYQNASTQYSPMGKASRTSPLITPKKVETPRTQDQIHPPGSSLPLPVPSPVTHNLNLSSPVALEPAPRPQTPRTKRRQFKETAESGSSTATAQSSPLKRTKPAKSAAKVLPMRYELCAVEDMVILIADMISELIETNDNLPLMDVVLTRFHSRTPPGISVIDYLQRLAKHATLSPPLLLSMVYYIDRLCSLYPAFSVTSLTVHRFLITAATVSAKGLSDSFWNNSTYARVGGIKLAELGLLELEFLYRLDWRIVPNPEVLVDYYRGLVGRTEDYVLESDVDTEKADQSISEETCAEIGEVTKPEITDGKWMQHVADTSAAKQSADDVG